MPVWFEAIFQDMRYAGRQLRKTPAFAVVAVLTLALGIGANTAVFSVMNAVLLASLPVQHPEQLVYLRTDNFPGGQTGYGDTSMRMQVYEALRKETRVFSDLMAWVPLSTSGSVAIRYGSVPEEAKGDMVSGNFFSGLGVRPVVGRLFIGDDEANHTQTVVLSYDFWTRRFGRSEAVLGQAMYVKGVPFTIIGVAGPRFVGLDQGNSTDFWVPFQVSDDVKPWGESPQNKRSSLYGGRWWFLLTIGRLQRGVTQEQAKTALQPIFEKAAYEGNEDARQPGDQPPKLSFTDTRGMAGLREDYEKPLRILMGMVVLVLVIACGNVAMMLIARNAARQREFSLRMALGGDRIRLFRQLLTESALLVAGGAVLGWLFAVWATHALAVWSLLSRSLAPDRSVLAFTASVSVLAAVLFGLAPLRSAVNVPMALALKTGAAASHQDRRKHLSGQAVLAAQMTFCLVLLVSAGLLVRTMRNLDRLDLGMKTAGLLVFGVNPQQHATNQAEYLQFYQSLMDRMRRIPGVTSVTAARNRPGSGWSSNTGVKVDGQTPQLPGGTFAGVRWNAVGPDFTRTLGVPLLLGRDFNDGDTASAPRVAIVNQTFAKRYLPNGSPIGHQITIQFGPQPIAATIVGVTVDSKYTSVREEARPIAYIPIVQVGGNSTIHVELRTAGSPKAFLPEVRRAMDDVAPDLPLLNPTTQEEQFAETLSQERLFARLASFFGGLAVLLVATGLYGTLAYKVARRTPEIGVRMALGAQRHQVLWLVMRESLVLCAIGAVAGLPSAFAGARLMRSMLYGLQPGDPVTLASALAGIAMVTVAASLVPAQRASSVDPMEALRSE